MKKLCNHSSNRSWTKILVCLFVLYSVFPEVKAHMAGTVFEDFNANGTRENSVTFAEPGWLELW
jgi:hypothetical protein